MELEYKNYGIFLKSSLLNTEASESKLFTN
jgi:hypothetical protein